MVEYLNNEGFDTNENYIDGNLPINPTKINDTSKNVLNESMYHCVQFFFLLM